MSFTGCAWVVAVESKALTDRGERPARQAVPPGVEHHGKNDDGAGDDTFDRFRRADLRESGFEGGDDQHAEE
jgi:hypothetical protein